MAMTPVPQAPARLSARALWAGWAVWGALTLVGVAVWMPDRLSSALAGVLLGAAYQTSLFWNARRPRAVRAQLAFSALRMLAFAWMIVASAGGVWANLAIVICGFLSYKGGVAAMGAAQLVAFCRAGPRHGSEPRR